MFAVSAKSHHAPILAWEAHIPIAVPLLSHVQVHISGPYWSIDHIDIFNVISLVDCVSRYVLTRAGGNVPTASDCSQLLRATFERFHVSVDFVNTDEGIQFVSAEFARTAKDVGCAVVTTPVRSSWANGHVERWHRKLNEFQLRTQLGDGLPPS